MQQATATTRKIPASLIDFDSMPDSAFVRLPVVKALYGVSGATIWRGCAKGLIPAPVKLSQRCTAWNIGLLRADLAAKGGK